MRTVLLNATVTASGDNIASTANAVGRVVGIDIQIVSTAGAPATGDFCAIQIATFPLFQTSTGVTGIMGQAAANVSLLTSGAGNMGISKYIPVDFRIEQGGQVYMSASEAGGETWSVSVILYIQ